MKLTSHSLLIPVLALGAAISTQAQEKLLPPTYQIGKEYVLESKQEMEMDMGAIGAALGQPNLAGKTTTQMVMEITSRCEKHSVPNQRVVKTKISRVKMDMNAMGMEMKYDSSEEGGAETMLGKQMGGIVGTEFEMILGADDKVISVDGLDNLPGGGLGGAGIDPEQLKQLANPTNQLGIPAAGVTIGESWDHGTEISLGGQVGKVKSELNLKYTGDEDVDGSAAGVIATEGKMSMAMDAQAGGAAAAGIKVKVDDGVMKGQMRIDKALRFVRDGLVEIEMTTKMGNPGNPNQELTIPMKIKQTVTLKSVTDL